MAPVALGIEIADIESLLQTVLDRRHRAGDLAGNEGFSAHRPFMVKQNAIGGMDAVGLAVIDGDPIGVELGRGIRRARIEGRGLPLRLLLRLAVKLGGRGLVESDPLLHAQDADRLKQPERAERVSIGGVFRRLEAHLHVALRGEIVDLVGLRLLQDADEIGGVGQIAVVQEEPRFALMRIDIEIVDAGSVE